MMKRLSPALFAACLAALKLCISRAADEAKPAIGLASLQVPPGFTVELAAGPERAPYGMAGAFDDRGRLFVAESSGKNIKGKDMPQFPECRIRLLEDTDGNGVFERSRIFADKLSLPMGVLWHQGRLFVASPPDLLRFTDRDDDGVADERQVLLTGWKVLNTASLHGPYLGPDGWLYLTHGRHGYKITTQEGELLEGLASRIWRCRPDGAQLERVCGGGFDNPVELIFTAAGQMIGTMTYFTDPQHGQRDALMHWVEGGVYNKWHECVAEFKHTGELLPPMTRFARIAPAGLMQYRGTSFGLAYQGNLFSAQFNPHRIQRHRLFTDGATFRTEDEDFLTSTDPDFHPCDVLEDADGSLLVIDTGGWYIDACPLSRVHKPEVQGGIYRIRPRDAPPLEDPRGRRLDWQQADPTQLAQRLADPRPAVRDHAQELLVAAGEKAVPALADLRRQHPSSDVRCAAIWALSRIGAPAAQAEVRRALQDDHAQAQIAAAHAVGMARDRSAGPALIALLQHPAPSVRLAAATALGQLGEAKASAALLAAAAQATDRFLEHGITYALIKLRDAPAAVAALRSASAKTRKAALIALDQMDGSPLRREHLAGFLHGSDAELRRTVLWVISHHRDWSGEVVAYLRDHLAAPELPAGEAASVRETLLAFCGDAAIQTLVSEGLTRPAAEVDQRLFLLGVMDRSSLKRLPPGWIAALGAQLGHPDPPVRARALALIRSRGIRELDDALAGLAGQPAQPAMIRVSAFGALLGRTNRIDSTAFDFLIDQLDPARDTAVRLASAQVLAKAALTPDQTVRLAQGPLARADALTLPPLLDAFGRETNETAGQAIVAGLLKTSVPLNVLAGGRLQRVLTNYSASVRASARPLVARLEEAEHARQQRLDELLRSMAGGDSASSARALTSGDVGRGRSIFFGQKAACSTCHAIGTEGGRLGPDLTSIGAIRAGRDILEAIVFPSASLVPGYESYQVETADDVFNGVLGEQTPEAVVLRTAAETEVRLLREDIRSLAPATVSVMPEGLDASLSREELMDLLAFLQAQNGEEWLLPRQAQR